MAKQYVYWRTQTGEPSKKNDGKYAPRSLLEKIGESQTDNSIENGISWHLFDLPNYEYTVCSMMIVLDPDGNELNETDTKIIGQKALHSICEKQVTKSKIDPNTLLQAANKEAAKYFRKSIDEYILITSLSVDELPLRQINVNNCQVSTIKRSDNFIYPESLRETSNESLLKKHLTSTNYLRVKVKTSGRSIFEASDKALESLSLLRGLWTLFATINKKTKRFGSKKQEPIGVISIGPVHTLHHPDGSPATDLFWYEPGYLRDASIFKPSKGWESIKKEQQIAIRKLKKHPFGSIVERLIMRYAEALDQSNLDQAFLQMWSILEKITDTIGANYDKTIERTVWIYKDQKLAKEKLEFLRLRRNQYVHSAKTSEEGDVVAYFMKHFIDSHLRRLIFNEMKVNSITEYGNFLSLSTSIASLEKSRKKLNYAIRLRKSN